MIFMFKNNSENITQNIYGSHNNQAAGDIYITNIYGTKQSTYLLEKIPSTNKEYVKRTDLENGIREKIYNVDIIQIYGISGIGKSEVVKKVIEDISFDKKYWITCNDNDENINLNNVATISQKKINILDNVISNKTLIVLDNYNGAIKDICEDFREVNKQQSKLIIISKEKTNYRNIDNVLVDYMTPEEANLLFDVYSNENFSAKEFISFLDKIDKHPMTLQILKNYLSDSNNGISISDFKSKFDSIVNLEDKEITSSQKICQKIIGLYYYKSKQLYYLLGLIDSNLIEANFLKSIILSDIQSLVNRNFLKFEGSYYYIHSIILYSIKSIVSEDINELKTSYEKKIIKYFEEKIELRDLSFYRFCAYNNNFLKNLEKITNNNYIKILIYNAYIIMHNYHERNTVINNIQDVLENIKPERYFEIKLLIEQYELEISCISNNEKEEKNKLINIKIQQLEKIKDDLKEFKTKQLLEHHIGKLYNWNGQYEKAVNVLEFIVKQDENEYSSILQLCRAYRHLALEDKSRKQEYVNNVYEILKNLDFNRMPISIFLEIISLIIYQPFNTKEILNTCLWANFELFEQYAKLYSDNKIFEHIYLIIGKLSSNLYYTKKSFYKEWFQDIEHPNIKDCDEKLLYAMINIYCYEVKRRQQACEQYDNLLGMISTYWKIYKEDYLKYKTNISFLYKPVIECFISLDKIDLAEKELSEIYDETNEWHLRYKSQILSKRNNFKEALKYINKVLDICGENYFGPYLETFENDKKYILSKINEE